MKETEEKVIDILSGIFEKNAEDIKTSDRVIEDLSADSLHIVAILNEIEKVFGIYIPENAIEDIRTVADIINYIDGNN